MLTQIIRGIIFIVVFDSCSQHDHKNLLGSYVSTENRLLARLSHPFVIIVGGDKLELRADSTYYYEICSSYWTGKWKLENDSVILAPLRARNKDSSETGLRRYTFFLKKNGELYMEFLVEGNRKAIDILVKKDE